MEISLVHVNIESVQNTDFTSLLINNVSSKVGSI